MGEETEPTAVAEGVTADEPARDHRRKRKKLLHKSLLELMEFYLGDVNLTHDKFLSDRIQGKPFVYVDLSLFLTFNRVKALTSDIKDIANSVKHSQFLQLSDDETQVCRKTPIKEKENEDDCTIYVEQLGPDVNHEILTKVFSEFGPVDYISLPRYSHNGKFKGFAFVEFRDPECAKKALELLSAKGCCLSPHMAPEELVSVKTFDVNDKEQHIKEGSVVNGQSNDNNNKRKHSDDDEINQSTDENVPQKSDEDEEPHEKKMKTLEGAIVAEVIQSEGEEESGADSKKRKLPSSENVDDKIKSDLDEKTDEDVEPARKKAKSDTEGASETEEDVAVNSAKQKKRKRKKKMKKDKVTASSLGLRVLPKREWKQLRNKYLNMQREVMTLLKQQMYGSTPEAGRPKVEEQYKPGTVIKVTLEEPVTNSSTTKAEFRIHPEIVYIDSKEGNPCVYLRTSSTELAMSIVQTKHWPNMEVLQGEEETAYWDKIKTDRLEYFQHKKLRNRRGRTKLLKRAEKFQEKQI